jgi:hypothetical protein
MLAALGRVEDDLQQSPRLAFPFLKHEGAEALARELVLVLGLTPSQTQLGPADQPIRQVPPACVDSVCHDITYALAHDSR